MPPRKKPRRQSTVPPDSSPGSSLTSNNNHFYRSSAQVSYRATLLRNSSANRSLYLDIGDSDRICEFCGTYFWYDERLVSASVSQRSMYTQCCKEGRVTLPYPERPHATVVQLYEQLDFLTNIRAYNSMFSMTSFGAIVDDTVNDGSGPYVFKIEGQVHHWLGTLCPPPNERPRFLQMYIYDTENEVSNRLHAFTSDRQSRLKPEIVAFLLKTLETYNKLVRLFRTTRDVCSSTDIPHFNVCLYGSKNAMSPDCIGAIVSDGDPTCCRFDIIIRQRDGGPQCINKLH
ncbi:hypothetical protein HanPI659440_Chr16g0654051 [Helianthus annuus]|nr:hypothetical protein HanPI659440_Chr16g0654051 [Helianthus annuus]